jgi:hypothetical protein
MLRKSRRAAAAVTDQDPVRTLDRKKNPIRRVTQAHEKNRKAREDVRVVHAQVKWTAPRSDHVEAAVVVLDKE